MSGVVSTPVRLTFAAIISAIAGAVFVGLTIEAAMASAVWSLAMMAGLPHPLIIGGEIAVLAAVLAMTAMLARHALKLEARRAAGETV